MIRKDQITIAGKQYEASYFGDFDISSWSALYSNREFWRIEGAGDDFKDKPKTTQVLPYNNYPPLGVEVDQAFVIDYYRKEDGAVDHREYHLADGTIWRDMPCTSEYLVTE